MISKRMRLTVVTGSVPSPSVAEFELRRRHVPVGMCSSRAVWASTRGGLDPLEDSFED
jgi:hypothetical protein